MITISVTKNETFYYHDIFLCALHFHYKIFRFYEKVFLLKFFEYNYMYLVTSRTQTTFGNKSVLFFFCTKGLRVKGGSAYRETGRIPSRFSWWLVYEIFNTPAGHAVIAFVGT